MDLKWRLRLLGSALVAGEKAFYHEQIHRFERQAPVASGKENTMSIDKSLRRKDSLQRARNVLTRGERIKTLRNEERWQEGRSPFGLPKVKVIKVVIKKAKKAKEEEAAPAEGEAAAATATAAPAAGDKKASEKKAPEKKGGEKK